jgi:hypothetical protein
MHLRRVVERCIPITPALGREIQDIVDGSEQIEAALLNIIGLPRVGGVEVEVSVHFALLVSR